MIVFTIAVSPESVRRTRVLLVEDHLDTRQMYAEYLRLSSFDVVEAADGSEALQLAAAQVPDVIVTDLSLPGIGGLELIEQLRADRTTSRVPVIALSGFAEEAGEHQPPRHAPDRWILKPCLPDALAAVIAEVLAGPLPRSTP